MYTIKEVAEIVEENEHTIRYYAKLGLFPNIVRDKYNARVFSDADIEDVRFVIMLADTGMPLEKIKQFMDLTTQGDQTINQRADILQQHQAVARARMVKLQKEIQLLEWKSYQLHQQRRKE